MKIRLFHIFSVVLAASSTLAIEVPLTYVRHEEAKDRSFQPSGYAGLAMKRDLPEGDWRLPDLNGASPLYTLVPVAGGLRLLVLSRQRADDIFYNRIHFDSNANGDLTDDPVVDGKVDVNRQHDYCSATFPPIDTLVKQGDRETPFSFTPSITMSRFSSLGNMKSEEWQHRFWLMLRANCHYECRFTFDGHAYRAALSDANCDGRFDRKLTYRKPAAESPGHMMMDERSDLFFLSTGNDLSPHEWHHLGDLLALDGKLLEVGVDIAGGIMTLDEVTEGLAPLKLSARAEQLTILDRDAGHCVMARQPVDEIQVPVGSYRIVAHRMLRKDEWGDRWIVRGAGDAKSSFVPVKPGTEAVLMFGEPLTGTVTGSQRRGSTVHRLSFKLTGAGGESISEVAHISGSRTETPLSSSRRNYPKEPSYQIAKPDGEIVARGTFEYG